MIYGFNVAVADGVDLSAAGQKQQTEWRAADLVDADGQIAEEESIRFDSGQIDTEKGAIIR